MALHLNGRRDRSDWKTGLKGKPELYIRAAAHPAADRYGSAQALDDVPGHGKTEARAIRLLSEEGVEDIREVFFADSFTRVGDRDDVIGIVSASCDP